jgi:hypothetical protein
VRLSAAHTQNERAAIVALGEQGVVRSAHELEVVRARRTSAFEGELVVKLQPTASATPMAVGTAETALAAIATPDLPAHVRRDVARRTPALAHHSLERKRSHSRRTQWAGARVHVAESTPEDPTYGQT